MKKSVIKLPDNTTTVPLGQSVTSANILCKYMKKPEYLYDILRFSAIKPRYVEEIIDYLNLPRINSITIPMICFCDIPFSKVSNHTENYGAFGIAFSKEKCMRKNVQPITYINPYSNYYSDLRETLIGILNSDETLEKKWQFLTDFLLTQLSYSKPIIGDMTTEKGKKKLLFKDECEWRYIPKLPNDMELVLSPKNATPEGRNIFNEALASNKCKTTWFRFNPEDVCYLIVPNEIEASNLINFINTRLRKLDRNTRNILISKIEITSKIAKDY